MKKANKLLLGGALLGTAATAASYAVTDSMMRLALDRTAPAYMEKLQRKAPESEELAKLREQAAEAGERLANTTHETVEILSHDGLKLQGHWFEAKEPRRILIAMHGWRSAWNRDFAMIADFFRSEGCSVLYVEQRAQGESEGKYMGFGLLERYDCRSWCDWVWDQFGNSLPVYLCGVSMGASTVLMAGGSALPENVIGILADCGYSSPRDIIKKVIRQLGLPAELGYPFVKLGARLYGHFDLEECSPEEMVKHCTVPVLFFHGESDDYVPCHMSRINYEACPAKKLLVTIPGAGHGLSYLMGREAYLKAAREFFGPNASAKSVEQQAWIDGRI